MRRIAFITTLLFALVGVILWISQSFVALWEPALRSQLEKQLGKALQSRVRIEQISLSFLHPIHLKNVEVWETEPVHPGLIFRAKAVSLTLSLVDLPRAIYHKDPLETVGLISLDTPLVILSPSNLKGRHPQKSRSLPLLFTLVWDHGTFQWKDPHAPHGSWSLYQAEGSYRIRGPKMDLMIGGMMEGMEQIQLRWSAFGHTWKAQGHLTKVDISSWITWVQHASGREGLPEGWKVHGGFDFDFRARGRLPLVWRQPWNWIQEAQLTLLDTQLQGPPTTPPISLEGVLVMKKSRISLSHAVLRIEKNSFDISGTLWPFAATPQMDFRGIGRGINLSMFHPYLAKFAHFTAPLRGHGLIDVSLKGNLTNPDISIDAKIPEGDIGQWPFRNASLHARRLHDHWEFLDNSLNLWDGVVSMKGSASTTSTDIQLSGQELSLQAVTQTHGVRALKGRLDFSLASRGPWKDPQITGALWLNDFSWGSSFSESLRGDVEMAHKRFRFQAASSDAAIRFQIEGHKDPTQMILERFDVRLRSGASLTAHAKWAETPDALEGTMEAHHLVLPGDIPLLSTLFPSLRGRVDLQGQWSGSWADPVFRAEIVSPDLGIGTLPPAKARAVLSLKRDEIVIPTFTMEPGYEGSWQWAFDASKGWILRARFTKAPADRLSTLFMTNVPLTGILSGELFIQKGPHLEGQGHLTLDQPVIQSWPLSKANLNFKLKDTELNLEEMSLRSEHGQALLKGLATWDRVNSGGSIHSIHFTGEGKASGPQDPSWAIPLHVTAHFYPSDSWRGDLILQAPEVNLRGTAAEPLETHVRWDSQHVHWYSTHWGTAWTSEGMLDLAGHQPTWSGRMTAHHVSLPRWQYWFWPQTQEPLDGILTSTFTLTGSLWDPQVHISARVENAQWRAFQFQSQLEGVWTRKGLEPFTMTGRLRTGGQFRFGGRVAPTEQTASGSLELTQFNLEPLGKSLSFPQPLQGSATGTFTVGGPLNQLRLTGHLEGGPLSYGRPQDNPIKLKSWMMNAALAPSPDRPTTTRLAIKEALAKTEEEEVRLDPESFVEFSKNESARFQIGTEIRNLHLSVFTLFGGLDLRGTWQIKAQGFAFQGDAYTRSLFINDYQLEQGRVNVDYYNRVVTFPPPSQGPSLITGAVDFSHSPQFRFKDFFISGKEGQGLVLKGEIGPSLWDFKMVGQGLDISALSGLAGFPYPLEGTAHLTLRGTGDSLRPHVQGDIDVHDGKALGLGFRTGVASFIWQDQRMTFTRLQLADPGRYNLTGAGVFPLGAKKKKDLDDQMIDFSVRLQDSNLGLLRSFTSEIKQAKGPVQGLLQIKGTTEHPLLRGSLKITNGDVLDAHYFKHLRNFHMALEFDGDELVVREFRGRSGRGEFRGGGHVTFSGFEPKAYDLHLEVPIEKGIDVQVPELAIPDSPFLAKRFHFFTRASRCDVQGHVLFRGPADAPVFSGEAHFSQGHFTFPPSTKHPPPPAFLEWVRRIHWDVDLGFADGAWFENELVEADLLGHLRLKGPSDRLRVDGGMDIDQGKISYLWVEFDIRQARFDIRSEDTGSMVINTPYVRGVGESHVQTLDAISGRSIDDTITLTIDYGPVDEIKPRLVSSSNPALSQDKLLARVTQLETQNLSPQQRTALYQQQMVQLLDTSLASPLAKKLLRSTGLVDKLSVTQTLNPAAVPGNPNLPSSNPTQSVNPLVGTKVTVMKDFSKRLSLGYGLRFDQITTADLQNRLDLRSDVELSYRWFRNIYLKGIFELPTTTPGILPDQRITVEPRIRFGWWGYTNKAKSKKEVPKTPSPVPSAPQ